MEMNNYQNQASETAIYKVEHQVIYPALGLAAEAGEVANKVKKMLARNNKEADARPGEYLFQVSDYTESFEETASIFYGKEINLEEKDIW